MIKETEYKKRRDTLASKMDKNSVMLLFSSSYKTRSNDTEFPYRQNSNFYYMTGFKEDNSVLVLVKKNKKYKSFLFVNKKDKTKELWNGKRLGVKEAKDRFLVDQINITDKFNDKLKKVLEDKQTVYYDFNELDSRTTELKKQLKTVKTHKDIAKHIELMRLIKSDSEIALIKEAVSIAKLAHINAMKCDKLDAYEYQVQAQIEHTFKYNGAYSDAYTTIVASGNNANTLHYIQNEQKLKNGDLILIDAGCEYEYYTSDITRTIPVNTKFTDDQKEVYNLVLDAQQKVLDAIGPNVKRSKLQRIAAKCLTEALVKLGVLKGDVKKLIKQQKYKQYYPHGIGHWLGIDVHDQCPYKDENSKEIRLQKGMVITIEPGLYLDAQDKNVPKKYAGIGVRIEDDILITKDGYENLSKEIPKTIQEIENISK